MARRKNRTIRPRVEIDRGLHWHVAYAVPQQERKAAGGLSDLFPATYLPEMVEPAVRRGRKIERLTRPLGRYVFYGLPEGQGSPWAAIRLDEVQTVLCNDGQPLRVPGALLQDLADRLTGHQQDSLFAREVFLPGQVVRITRGPFASFAARVETATDERVRALVSLFGRPTLAEFSIEDLERAA